MDESSRDREPLCYLEVGSSKGDISLGQNCSKSLSILRFARGRCTFQNIIDIILAILKFNHRKLT